MLFLYWLIKRQYPEMLLGCKIPAEPMLSKLLAKTISLSEHNNLSITLFPQTLQLRILTVWYLHLVTILRGVPGTKMLNKYLLNGQLNFPCIFHD